MINYQHLQHGTIKIMSEELLPLGKSNESEVQAGEILPHTSTSAELIQALGGDRGKKYGRFAMAALGSVPWVGSYLGILGALAGLSAEHDQDKINGLLGLWIKEHEPKLKELEQTLIDITSRLDGLGDDIQERIESPDFLALVRDAFRSWDDAETEEKREYIKRLISNAGATKLVPDDLVRLFISWIDTYHESHFAVIKEIFKAPGITRGAIWDAVHTKRPREDSAEADLFRFLIRDLSLGGVIRQEKATTGDGRFLKAQSKYTPKGQGSRVAESAFEDSKPYVLTELGKEFIHYVLSDVVRRIE